MNIINPNYKKSMKKEFLVALHYLMRDYEVNASEIKEAADYAPLIAYVPMVELPVPMSFQNTLTNCRQRGKKMMSMEQAQMVYQNLGLVNKMLQALGEEPIKPYLYWVEDGDASKPYLAKVFDFRNGTVKEVRKSESFRARFF